MVFQMKEKESTTTTTMTTTMVNMYAFALSHTWNEISIFKKEKKSTLNYLRFVNTIYASTSVSMRSIAEWATYWALWKRWLLSTCLFVNQNQLDANVFGYLFRASPTETDILACQYILRSLFTSVCLKKNYDLYHPNWYFSHFTRAVTVCLPTIVFAKNQKKNI